MPAIKVSAVIVAAGRSTRMGKPKIFIPLGGRPLIAHTLSAFEQCEAVSEIVLVAGEEYHDRLRAIAEKYGINKLSAVVRGGDTRQVSVHCGVAACTDTDYVAIHDGARPLVTPALIEKVVCAAVKHGAAAAAVHTKDTVKIADEQGMVLSTPNRDSLWNVQTPQIFERSLYERAYALATERQLAFTDDCQLIEAVSHPVKLVEGSYANLKVTTPDDIPLAEELLG